MQWWSFYIYWLNINFQFHCFIFFRLHLLYQYNWQTSKTISRNHCVPSSLHGGHVAMLHLSPLPPLPFTTERKVTTNLLPSAHTTHCGALRHEISARSSRGVLSEMFRWVSPVLVARQENRFFSCCLGVWRMRCSLIGVLRGNSLYKSSHRVQISHRSCSGCFHRIHSHFSLLPC